MNILQLNWLPPQQVWNSFGKHRWKRITPISADIADGWWEFYKKNKFSLLNKGISVWKEKGSGQWYICHTVDDIKEFGVIKSVVKSEDLVEKPFVSKLKPYTIKNKDGLREWQIKSVERLVSVLNEYGGALDSSDTGTGKTYSAIATARELGYNIGVICPISVKEPWRKVVCNHFKMKSNLLFIVNYESLRTGKYKDIGTWVKDRKTHRETFTWHTSIRNTLLIFDESHKAKGLKSQNAEILLRAKNQGYKILCCSATSAISPLEMRAVGSAIELYKGSFWKWAKENGCDRGRWGYEFNGNPKILKRLHVEIFQERGIRLQRDIIKGFPECLIEAEAYSIDDQSKSEMNKIYSEMEKEIKILEKRTGMSNKDKVIQAMTLQLRMRQKFELLKIPLFLDMIEDAIADGFSVAIFLNFTETINALAKRLDTKCIVDGRNKGKERDDIIESFQLGKSRVILLNIQAGGCGVSLHNLYNNYPRLALISPNPSAVLMRQSLGRIWRDDSKTKGIQKIIFTSGTAEEDVCNNVKNKLKNMDLLQDGDLALLKTTEF